MSRASRPPRNQTGELLGTALDRDWLRHGLYTRVDLAPDVEDREASGIRLHVLHAAAANEPVEDTSGRIRWRVGTDCVAVDRAEWRLHRQTQAGHDSMAGVTGRTVVDVGTGAVVAARRHLRDAGFEHHATETIAERLRRLGVLHPDGCLTQAGALLFCPTDPAPTAR